MSNIKNKQDIKTNRRFFKSADMRELASHLVELHMDTKRSEEVLRSFKRHFRRSEPIMGEALIEEMGLAIADYKAEPTERRLDTGA